MALLIMAVISGCSGSVEPERSPSPGQPPAPTPTPDPSPAPDPYAPARAELERLRALEAGCCDLHEDAP